MINLWISIIEAKLNHSQEYIFSCVTIGCDNISGDPGCNQHMGSYCGQDSFDMDCAESCKLCGMYLINYLFLQTL